MRLIRYYKRNPMSQELELEILQADAKKKPKNDFWKKGARLTKEHIAIACKSGGDLELEPDDFGIVDKILKFGKYKGKTYNWVYKNDPRWMTWAFENIQGFEAKAKAAKFKEP